MSLGAPVLLEAVDGAEQSAYPLLQTISRSCKVQDPKKIIQIAGAVLSRRSVVTTQANVGLDSPTRSAQIDWYNDQEEMRPCGSTNQLRVKWFHILRRPSRQALTGLQPLQNF